MAAASHATSSPVELPAMLSISGLCDAKVVDPEEIIRLETASYPSDEAATPAKIKMRLAEAGLYFYCVLGEGGRLVAYICGTLAAKMTEESMAIHDPSGTTLCIHSVVTDPTVRKRGIASWMVQQYCRVVAQTSPQVEQFALLAKEHNTGLYGRCGFVNCGPSGVDHGADTWMLMKRPVHSSERNLPLVIVDAFTSKAVGGGNQAGVVIFPRTPPPRLCVVKGTDESDALPPASKEEDEDSRAMSAWMQEIAIELGFSETTFLQPLGAGSWSIRWFTPGGEVDLCGHATLASAAALKRSGALHPNTDSVVFASRSGRLAAAYTAGKPARATLDFPAEPAEPVERPEQSAIAAAAGPALWPSATEAERSEFVELVGRNRFDVVIRVTRAGFDAIVPHPDPGVLNSIECRGIIVTALGGKEASDVDFVSRFFAPRCDIDEDPVTGSAHCCLAPLWAPEIGKTAMVAEQRSARGGRLSVELVEASGRVLLTGDSAVTVVGQLDVSPPV